MVLPDKKIGIVCQPENEKGVLRVQLPGKKIYINHKRVKLHVPAGRLYPGTTISPLFLIRWRTGSCAIRWSGGR